MPTNEFGRRAFLTTAAASALAVAAARTASHVNAGPAGPVTISHTFGQTTIPGVPNRVISAGFTEHDDLLAVGMVPVAVTKWFGDEPNAVWPWARSRLNRIQPVVLSLYDNGFQYDRIAALDPDLIVATNAGVDQDSYERLSAIAPTVPSTGEQWFEPWKAQATTIGQAVSQADRMNSLISQVDQKFAAVAQSHPQFNGKKVLLLQGTIWQDSVTATLPGWRTEFLTQMGFRIPDSINAFAKDDHRALVPPEQIVPVLNDADVLIWTTESDADQAALLADPAIQQLNATAQNRNVFTDKDLAGAIAFSSPISLPVVADRLPPMLSSALR